MNEPVLFTITLQHLTRDASAAGAALPPIELEGIGADELRRLLDAFVALAPCAAYPVCPEMRIVSPHGRFLVQLRDGRARFSSWSLRGANREFTPDEIYAAITGLEREAEGSGSASGPPASAHAMPSGRVLRITLLVLGILGTNAVTAWMLTRPLPDLLPPHQLLSGQTAARVLEDMAGEWRTGSAAGDRILTIADDGTLRWVVLGENSEIDEATRFTAQPAHVAGKKALLTSTRAVIEQRDAATIVFFGDTYRRKMP